MGFFFPCAYILFSAISLVFLSHFFLYEFSSFCQSHLKQRPKSVLWCDRENNPTSWAGPLPSLEMVSEGRVFASPDFLRFRDPDSFVAGNLTTCLDHRDQISVGYEKRDFVLAIIRNGVDVFDFFTPFNGNFQGKLAAATCLLGCVFQIRGLVILLKSLLLLP